MNKAEEKIVKHIEEYGCHVTSVFDPKEEDPSFTYSIGISQCTDAPEVIVLGLRSELSSWIVNEYNRRVTAGEKFEEGKFYEGFLDGFEVTFEAVAKKYREEFMLSCNWLYKGSSYNALQLIYPTVDGIWPWDNDASDSFKAIQASFQEPARWEPQQSHQPDVHCVVYSVLK
ncbi:DUF4262 domain-containing protein [Microbulbifer sp. VTAC004]|uniref:DUF4262 domain-containing protein n=2 Tax=Microbulbifer TaxID=48073 RepID=UPI0040395264